MIRDILVENPQSAKSDALLDALDQRWIPMPDSMMAQIMEGQAIMGPMEVLEQELAGWRIQYDSAMRNLILLYHQDTTGTFGADSLISLMNHDSSLTSRYNLVSLYYGKGLFATGNSMLSSIPSFFTLSDPQEEEHTKYLAIFPVLQQACTDSNGIESLDSLQLGTLATIALNNNSIAGAWAKNMLIKKGLLAYEEPILSASSLKETKKWRPWNSDPSHENPGDYLLRVFPNPANRYFTVEYRSLKPMDPQATISVSVNNLLGKEVTAYSTTRYYDQFVVSTEKLPSGAYFIHLNVKGEEKARVKLIISK